jgi:RNA polymerase sigma factor (sigma-70 family)
VWHAIHRGGIPADDRDDVWQEVWIAVLRDRSALRDQKMFPGWLAAVARNTCYHWRVRLARRGALSLDGPEAWTDDGRRRRLVDALVDQGPTAQQRLEDAATRSEVLSAVVGLPHHQRATIELLVYSDPPATYAEVATALGLALGSIGPMYGRAVARLRAEVQP